MSTVAGTQKYSISYKNIKAGTYSFKVVGDGSWTTGISWGDSTTKDGNYTITLTDTCNVTIYFDTSTYRISVEADYLKKDEYVLSGTGNLMSGITDSTGTAVGSWNKTDPKMTYNEATRKYTYDIIDVPANKTDIIPDGKTAINSNYAFKVIPYNDDQGDNIIFALYGDEDTYNLHFEYEPYTKKTVVKVTDLSGKDVTDSVYHNKVNVSFYSILGDENLTGDNWGNTNPSLAAYNGKMDYNTETELYEKHYKIKVPTDGTSAQYSFKIAANGTWDSGISYGGEDGGNITVSVASTDEMITEAELTITFNVNTGEIKTVTNPDVMKEITDENFIWYVTGTYLLRSNNVYTYNTKVYDTVRDITSKFSFSCGQNTEERGLKWVKNEERNKASNFIDSDKFDLHYNVEGQNITGTFEGNVITLSVRAITDENYTLGIGETAADKLLAQYYAEDFMPGKQWLTVNSFGEGKSADYKQWKQKYLAYNDYCAKKAVYDKIFGQYLNILSGTEYAESTEGKVTENNLIAYLEANPTVATEVAKKLNLEGTTTLLTLKSDMDSCEVKEKPAEPSMSETIYGSRHLRLIPSAYLEAGNDAKINVFQAENGSGSTLTNVVKYNNTNDNNDISFNDVLNNRGFSYYNFALTAGYLVTDKIGLGIYDNYSRQIVQDFNDTPRDDDKSTDIKDGTYFAMSSVFNNNVDDSTLAMGNYTDGGSRAGANLTVGEFRNESTIGVSKKISTSNDGTTETNVDNISLAKTIVKIFKQNTDSKGNVSLSLMNMDSNPNATGIYHNNYLKWTGQKDFTTDDEGKYTVTFYWTLSDGRYLTDSKQVSVVSLQPSLNKSVNIACSSPTDDDNSLEYNITYRNDTSYEKLSFAVLDVLPFNGSKRNYKDGTVGKATTYANNNWKLKSIKVTYSNETTKVKGLYYSTSNEMRDNSVIDVSQSNAADRIINSDGTLNKMQDYFEKVDSNSTDIDSVTAILLTGSELGIGESVTISFKLEYTPSVNEIYVNNAHFYVCSADSEECKISGSCDPVTTTIVSRNLSGYAWLDKNRDGIYNADEYAISGITATLCNNKGEVVLDKNNKQYTSVTDENGKYEFKNIPVGSYMVKFTTDKKLEINNKNYTFSDLKVTKRTSEIDFKKTFLNSRNISYGSYDSNKLQYAYYNIEMPSNSDIYYGRMTTTRNVVLENYNYSKIIQNVAFYDESDAISYDYAMYINKINESGEVLADVEFMLQFRYDNGDNEVWYPVYFVTEQKDGQTYTHMYYDILNNMKNQKTAEQLEDYNAKNPDSKIEYIFKTDEKGKIEFNNLVAGEYRLVEVKSAGGYNKLTAPIYFNLPYTETFKLGEDGKIINDNELVLLDENDMAKTDESVAGQVTKTYKRIGLKVVNNKPFSLPATGGYNQWVMTTIGVILMGIGLGIIWKSQRKKSKFKNQ